MQAELAGASPLKECHQADATAGQAHLAGAIQSGSSPTCVHGKLGYDAFHSQVGASADDHSCVTALTIFSRSPGKGNLTAAIQDAAASQAAQPATMMRLFQGRGHSRSRLSMLPEAAVSR